MVQKNFAADDFQELIVQLNDRDCGLSGYIVLHSTALGPAAGGCRLWSYASERDVLLDAIRLAKGMTDKNALAGLPFGGGKAVINTPREAFDRTKLFSAFAAAVKQLAGRYVTAEDVGTTVADMKVVRETTRHVAGIAAIGAGIGGDPSPWTARTVFDSIKIAAQERFGTDLKGLHIAVQGVGNVGLSLCDQLHEVGARLTISDVNEERARFAVCKFNAQVVCPSEIIAAEVDIFSPCALGGTIDDHSIDRLKAKIVCGAANNQLLSDGCAESLQQADILYVPDYVVNAGGIIAVAAEYLSETRSDALDRMDQVGGRVRKILREARSGHSTPLSVANRMAKDLVAGRRSKAA